MVLITIEAAEVLLFLILVAMVALVLFTGSTLLDSISITTTSPSTILVQLLLLHYIYNYCY